MLNVASDEAAASMEAAVSDETAMSVEAAASVEALAVVAKVEIDTSSLWFAELSQVLKLLLGP